MGGPVHQQVPGVAVPEGVRPDAGESAGACDLESGLDKALR
jgi:hypothetical protein